MNRRAFERLVGLGALTDAERQAFLDLARLDQAQEYVTVLEKVASVDVPPPSPIKKWDGRVQLLEAVAEYHARRRPAVAVGARSLRALPIALVAGVVLTAGAAATVITEVPLPGRPVNEVLSALGLKSTNGHQPDEDVTGGPPNAPGGTSDASPPQGAPAPQGQENPGSAGSGAPNVGDSDAPERGSSGGQGANPPGQGGENPGQGANPPGQGGENPGQGANPPGQGGENPGQGANPPGQGGENPGQGANPPGQGGENPGQGADPPGQGEENPGQGGENPGQGDSPPSQGGGDQGQGNRP